MAEARSTRAVPRSSSRTRSPDAPLHHEIDAERPGQQLDAGGPARLLHQGADDLAAGRVAARVQDPLLAVGRLAGQRQLRPLAVEARAPFDQLEGAGRSLFHENAHRRLVTQPVPRHERVLVVQRHLVVVREHGGEPALRLVGGRIGGAVLGQDGDAASRGGDGDGGAQTGNTAADDESVPGIAAHTNLESRLSDVS
jgi:hypothetical protein